MVTQWKTLVGWHFSVFIILTHCTDVLFCLSIYCREKSVLFSLFGYYEKFCYRYLCVSFVCMHAFNFLGNDSGKEKNCWII